VLADNGEWLPATHRIYRHDLAGGPLLTLGTHPVALANWVLGEPQELVAVEQDVPGGEVNGQVSMVLRHTGGAQSTINTTIMGARRNSSSSPGSQGRSRVRCMISWWAECTIRAGVWSTGCEPPRPASHLHT
jgi:predicted dehydrogenase